MKTTKKNVSVFSTESYLPIFNGYYGTILGDFLEDEDRELENINEERNPKLPKITFDNLKVDYTGARAELNGLISDIVISELVDLKLITKGEFQSLSSPREYNFYNDSINVKYTFNAENVETIKKYIIDNYAQWDKYLHDKYTSYDGFISSYDNYASSEDWSNIVECLKHEHKCGQILQFILSEIEGFEEMSIYDRICGDFYLGNYITVIEPEISEELKAEIANEVIDPNQLNIF